MAEQKKVALITGASRGLGREVAWLFATKGMALAIDARGRDALEHAADELSAITEVLALPGDIANPRHIDLLYTAAMDRFGRIDVVVNNASTIGASPMPALEDYPIETFLEVLRVNAVAPLHLIQLVLPQMREREEGVIVNITSDAAIRAYEGWGGYGASKAALEHLSQVLGEELRGSGVRLYVLDPGDMNTQLHRDAEPGVDLSHLPDADQIAPAVLRLVQEEMTPFGRFEAHELLPSLAETRH